ncbi:hypothetical protein [Collimonas pratensis]|uniref:hypothetical protein n=1 Tax=Collimonas pratensis TaxID=279113 RepID=UPI000783D2DA|nr:hypothetical protein [Collimonas pratensis]
MGRQANASAANAIAIGLASTAQAASTIAFGDSNTVAAAAGTGSIAGGHNSQVKGGTGAVALGEGRPSLATARWRSAIRTSAMAPAP